MKNKIKTEPKIKTCSMSNIAVLVAGITFGIVLISASDLNSRTTMLKHLLSLIYSCFTRDGIVTNIGSIIVIPLALIGVIYGVQSAGSDKVVTKLCSWHDKINGRLSRLAAKI